MSEDEEVCEDGILICLVQTYPILWNTNCNEYRDETKKINAWKKISEHMKSDGKHDHC